jgi:hypothetical protein
VEEEEIMNKTHTALKLSLAAAVAACALGATASAQPIRGTFTLPHEVRLGKAVLPAGAYTIRIDSVRGPVMVRTAAGQARALLFAQRVESADKDLPTSLLVTRDENQRTVRSFNWREGNQMFVFLPLTKAERKQLAKVDDSVMVARTADK